MTISLMDNTLLKHGGEGEGDHEDFVAGAAMFVTPESSLILNGNNGNNQDTVATQLAKPSGDSTSNTVGLSDVKLIAEKKGTETTDTTSRSSPATIILADQKKVECWNDEHFKKVRTRLGLEESFLENEFEFTPQCFKPGGGKGGELMAFTRNRRFLVKQLSKGDHAALLEVAADYVSHVLSGDTLLALIPLHFTYEDAHYSVMLNCLAKEGFGIEKSGYDYMYDLKGCADDKMMTDHGKKVEAVHKRVWHCWMWCGSCFWSDARRIYYTKKRAAYTWALEIPAEMRKLVVGAIKRDCENFLIPQGLMDYSLVVGSKILTKAERQQSLAAEDENGIATEQKITIPAETSTEELVSKCLEKPPTKPENFRAPLVFPNAENPDECIFLAVGIIDFLQRWTPIKKVAMCVKALERDKATIPLPHMTTRSFLTCPDLYSYGAFELIFHFLVMHSHENVKAYAICIFLGAVVLRLGRLSMRKSLYLKGKIRITLLGCRCLLMSTRGLRKAVCRAVQQKIHSGLRAEH
ncbi:unnamed protein product [Amoebophrya sp. A120]|nr:unnamed protein product [Amoebophrya sp. A120]|eukprot:GSA120T00012317001.1